MHLLNNDGYIDLLKSVKDRISNQRVRIILNANREMILLYWQVGKIISEKCSSERWGANVIGRLAKDLQNEFPDMKGFSVRNIQYMCKFAKEWNDYAFVQRSVAQIPWRTNILLFEKVADIDERKWYVERILAEGWSRDILGMQIESKLYARQGKAVSNFDNVLPGADSDLVQQTFKDPYLFDFLGTDVPRREAELEQKLTEHIQKFLLELGSGFAFVGRQYHLEVGNKDFYIDLLFYHLNLRCFVVVELKACEFKPEFVSQLNFYQNAINHQLRHEGDNPTIGLLLVKGKDEMVVRYSLDGYTNPIGVADWEIKLRNMLNKETESSLPTIESIEQEIKGKD